MSPFFCVANLIGDVPDYPDEELAEIKSDAVALGKILGRQSDFPKEIGIVYPEIAG